MIRYRKKNILRILLIIDSIKSESQDESVSIKQEHTPIRRQYQQ